MKGEVARQPAAATAVAPVATVAARAPDPVSVVAPPPKASPEPTVPDRPAPQPAAVAVKAKPAATAPRTQPNPARQPAVATRPIVSAAAAPARVEAPVREPEPAPAPVAAAPAPAETASASAPIRPFFETKDVTESPQIARRVEPQVPADLQARGISDVVVVRLLVSQSGHPSSVSLLRKSKGGQSMDDAVVAAVKQWTFSPARKKGEAVSCWLNVGVPVGHAN
jgi:protein TonB